MSDDEAKTKNNAIFHHSFRYSLPIDDRTRSGIEQFSAAWDDVRRACAQIFDKYIFQLECTEGENYHYQGYGHIKRKQRCGQIGNELTGLVGGRVSVQAASTNGIKALQDYCMKEETRVSGPWADHPLPRVPKVILRLSNWQETVVNFIKTEPDERSIQWIVDMDGHSGKTALARYLYYHFKIPTLTYGKASDLLNYVSKNQGLVAYVLNLTRSRPAETAMNDIYCALESIKDGIFVNTKYETGMCFMAQPHVVVFANFPPLLTAVSLDRWCIWKFEGTGMDKNLVRMYVPSVPTDI